MHCAYNRGYCLRHKCGRKIQNLENRALTCDRSPKTPTEVNLLLSVYVRESVFSLIRTEFLLLDTYNYLYHPIILQSLIFISCTVGWMSLTLLRLKYYVTVSTTHIKTDGLRSSRERRKKEANQTWGREECWLLLIYGWFGNQSRSNRNTLGREMTNQQVNWLVFPGAKRLWSGSATINHDLLAFRQRINLHNTRPYTRRSYLEITPSYVKVFTFGNIVEPSLFFQRTAKYWRL